MDESYQKIRRKLTESWDWLVKDFKETTNASSRTIHFTGPLVVLEWIIKAFMTFAYAASLVIVFPVMFCVLAFSLTALWFTSWFLWFTAWPFVFAGKQLGWINGTLNKPKGWGE